MKPPRTLAPALMAMAMAGALLSGCGRKAEPGSHFGEPFTTAPRVTIAQLLTSPTTFQRQSVRVQGVIERQCPAAGCWFFIRDDQGQSIKVELGDYLPKLPQNIGNHAEVEGEWIQQGEGHTFIGTRVTFTK